MAITVDWANRIINVPRNDMVLLQTVPSEIRSLDLNIFRLELKSLEASTDGMAYPKMNAHNTTVQIGGVILSRVITIVNGYTVTFEDGQYAVNLKGANSNVADVTNVNQVSVRSANSAGLQDLSTLLASAYESRIHIDVVNGQAGTAIPLGTRNTPVNNFSDAKFLADILGINEIRIIESTTISNLDFSSGYIFSGDNAINTTLTVDGTSDVSNCVFENLILQGAFDTNTSIKNCGLLNISSIQGAISFSMFNGTVVLFGGQPTRIMNCHSAQARDNVDVTPIIDMGGFGQQLSVREWSGGLILQNCTGGTGSTSIDINSGIITFESTISSGAFYVRGVAEVIDNSSGTATVFDKTVGTGTVTEQDKLDIANKVWDEDITTHTTVNTSGWLMQKLLTVKRYLGLK